MLLAVLNIFREKLPCSENFWRYKRNYELHMQNIDKSRQDQNDKSSTLSSNSPGSQSSQTTLGETNVTKKLLASP